jgi:uncharacterized membrane protein YqaE (UPF0057 family)
MILIAILFPGLSFLFRGKIIHFILCIILQLTVIGWLPAAIWAVMSISEERSNRRMASMQVQVQNVNNNNTSDTPSKIDELERLEKLKSSGVLTQGEFEEEKKRILNI